MSLSTNIFTTCQFLNEKIYNVSDVEATFLQRIKFSSRIVFFIKSKFVAKVAFENFFCKIKAYNFQRWQFKASLKRMDPGKNNLNRKQFLNQSFQYEWVSQPTFPQLVILLMNFFTMYQMLNQHVYNASSFQEEVCFFKIKFCCKTRFRNFFFAKLHRKNFKDGSLRLP